MPVKKIYMSDTYRYQHKAIVTQVGKNGNGNFVCLTETIFHPQGGAQPSDEGTINGQKVILLEHVVDEINHYVEGEMTLKVGDTVDLKIDQEKRLQYAALHSTGHVMAAIIREKYGMKKQTGQNHFPGQASVKLEMTTAKIPTKESFENDVVTLIKDSRKLSIVQKEGERCLAIEGLDQGLRCGGTHISNTNEIASFKMRNIKADAKRSEVSFGYECTHSLTLFGAGKVEHDDKTTSTTHTPSLMKTGTNQ